MLRNKAAPSKTIAPVSTRNADGMSGMKFPFAEAGAQRQRV
jgi:hypothetical protein